MVRQETRRFGATASGLLIATSLVGAVHCGGSSDRRDESENTAGSPAGSNGVSGASAGDASATGGTPGASGTGGSSGDGGGEPLGGSAGNAAGGAGAGVAGTMAGAAGSVQGGGGSGGSAGSDGGHAAGGEAAGGEAAGGETAGGSGGAGGAGDGLIPVTIIRGDPEERQWLTLIIEGRGLTADEGKVFRVRLGHADRDPERISEGEARVEEGRFSLVFPESNEWGLYKRRVAFIDVDRDGICTPGEDRIYSSSQAFVDNTTLILADSDPAPDLDYFPLTPGESECDILNMPWPTE